ncbi:MAG: mannosyltransferase family protein [Acidocella sp.]|nr:mannosyltransferase family protein [Acidocella sp.]
MLSALWPMGPHAHGPGLGDKFLSMDGLLYQNIALTGYRSQLIGSAQDHNIAFFPLYPLITRGVSLLLGSNGPWVFILPGLLFGLGSNYLFYRLAKQILPQTSAAWATLFFALWPACCFLFMGYATGLANLCALLSLHHYINGRRLRAAIWCGVGTAAAPALVFFAAGLCGDAGYEWLRDKLPLAKVPRLILFGLLSVGGLIGFMIFQLIKFHNPIAFVVVQQAWAQHTEDFSQHLMNLLSIDWYLVVFVFVQHAVEGILHGNLLATAEGRNSIDVAFQYMFDWLVFWASLAAIGIATRRFPKKPLVWTGACIWLGYLWFNVTGIGYFFNAIRLLYPVVVVFLLLGSWSVKHRILGYALLALSMMLATLEMSLVLAGYDVL